MAHRIFFVARWTTFFFGVVVGSGFSLLVSFRGGGAGAGAGASVEVLYREVSFPVAAAAVAVGMGTREGSFWMRW